MSIFNIVAQALTISAFDGIILVRKGAVYINGVQCVKPTKQITKPAVIRIGNQRLWVSPGAKDNYEQETISQPD